MLIIINDPLMVVVYEMTIPFGAGETILAENYESIVLIPVYARLNK